MAKPDQPLQPGDLVCGECGAGNKPTRKFCRRCGHDLKEAQVVHTPWWRRIFTRQKRSGPAAGTRPKVQGPPRRWPRRVIGLVLVLALIGGGAWLARDWVRPAYDRVLDRVQDSQNINPTKLKASSSSPGHAAKRARDGFSNRYWAPAQPGNGKGESLTATFKEPFRLVSLVITPGVSGKDEEAFLKNGRPHEIQLVMIHSDDARSVETIELEDKVGPASVDVHSSDVASVKLTLVSSYAGSADGSRTAIAEVEFRGRR